MPSSASFGSSSCPSFSRTRMGSVGTTSTRKFPNVLLQTQAISASTFGNTSTKVRDSQGHSKKNGGRCPRLQLTCRDGKTGTRKVVIGSNRQLSGVHRLWRNRGRKGSPHTV